MSAPMMNGLADKTALVTGASSGVGRVIAREFARRGAHVLMLGRDAQKLRAAAGEISRNGQIKNWAFDLTNDSAVQSFIDELKKNYSGIDFVVHSAGEFRMEPFATAPVRRSVSAAPA